MTQHIACVQYCKMYTEAPTREVYSESSIFLGRGNALVTEICSQDHIDESLCGGHSELEQLQDTGRPLHTPGWCSAHGHQLEVAPPERHADCSADSKTRAIECAHNMHFVPCSMSVSCVKTSQ